MIEIEQLYPHCVTGVFSIVYPQVIRQPVRQAALKKAEKNLNRLKWWITQKMASCIIKSNNFFLCFFFFQTFKIRRNPFFINAVSMTLLYLYYVKTEFTKNLEYSCSLSVSEINNVRLLWFYFKKLIIYIL